MVGSRIIKRVMRWFGLDIRRYNQLSSSDARLIAMLETHGVNLVFDVGANTGQFGNMLREAGYSGRIVSFEPLPDAYAKLLDRARGDALWEIAPRMAVGEKEEQIEFFVSGNSVSSSVLKMLSAHTDAEPKSGIVGKELVPQKSLDQAATSYLGEDSAVFVKVDTQGYEDRVLNGATALLERAVGIQLELSTQPLYEGQILYGDLMRRMENAGFSLWGIVPGFVDRKSGRMLQFDGIWFK